MSESAAPLQREERKLGFAPRCGEGRSRIANAYVLPEGRGVPEVQSLQEHIPVRHPRNSAQRDEVVRPGAQEASSAAFSV